MKPIHTQEVETARGPFLIEVYKDLSGTYSAVYHGSGLAQAQPPEGAITFPLMKDIRGKVSNCADAEEALAKAHEEIKRLYGKIIRAHPRQAPSAR